jgi:hypothetical protein
MKRRKVFHLVIAALLVAMFPMTGLADHADPPSWDEGAEITIDAVTHNSVTYSWPEANDPGQGIDRYRAHIFLEGDDEEPMLSEDVGLSLTHTFTGLLPETDYWVWVEAIANLVEPDTEEASGFLGETGQTFTTLVAPPPPPPPPPPLVAPTVGAVDPATGQWHLRDANGVVTTFYFGNPGDYPFMGDWNCDGSRHPRAVPTVDGFVYLRNSNTKVIADIRFFFGNPGDMPIAGDFNNDGCDTVSFYRPSEPRFYIINKLGSNDGGLGAADFSFMFGNPGDKPFVGDFNGNGQTPLACTGSRPDWSTSVTL